MFISSLAARSANWTVTKITEDNLLSTVIKGSTILALLFSVSGFLIYSVEMAMGIAAGSTIAVINFIWQRSIMQKILHYQPGRPAFHATLRYLLRLSITALLLYFIIISGFFSVAGLLLGLSVVVVMIVFCTVYFAIQNKGD